VSKQRPRPPVLIQARIPADVHARFVAEARALGLTTAAWLRMLLIARAEK